MKTRFQKSASPENTAGAGNPKRAERGGTVRARAKKASDPDPDPNFCQAEPPPGANLEGLRAAAAHCRACPLWRNATCTVFGEGPANARIVFVGEQPGDQEDRVGKPFVGPAGRLLDKALADVGIDRNRVYVTNAVKHFKFQQRGQRRMHDTPNPREITACKPWLEAELERLKPELIVALGLTATRALLNKSVRLSDFRGAFAESEYGKVLVTIHPSALLRLRSHEEEFEPEYKRLLVDLKLVRPFLH